MSLSKQQLAFRKTRLSGTDLRDLCDGKPAAVYRRKFGPHEPIDNIHVDCGTALEPVIGTEYTRQTGIDLQRMQTVPDGSRHVEGLNGDSYTVSHPEHDFLCATCDFEWVERPNVLVEAKARSVHMRQKYGDAGTNEMLEADIIQVALQCMVLDRSNAELAVLFDRKLEIFVYDRDPDLEGALVDVAARFHRDHMVTGNPPPPDASDAYTQTVIERYPQRDERLVLDVGDEDALFAVLDELMTAQGAEKDVRESKALAMNRLREAMGECHQINSSLGKITRVQSKPGGGRKSLNYKQIVEALVRDGLVTQDVMDEVSSRHMTKPKVLDYLKATWA